MSGSVPLRDEPAVAPDDSDRRTFDVFLSHNSADKPIVERIAERLKRARLEPWLDVWSLVPGADWQPGLAEGLAASRACAVFVGPHDGGAWKNQEVAVALDRAASDLEFRVFLVLLPGLPEQFDAASLSPFLRMRTWVDYRAGLDDERAFEALVAAIQGVPLGPSVPIEPEAGRSPYRGLEAFEEEHAEFFFGRDADVQRLLEKLKATRFLAVLGASGSGKSSLVRAGLVPALKRGELAGATGWEIPIMRPGAHPLEALAAQVVGLGGSGGMQATLDGLAADPRSLHLAATLALTDRPAGTRLLLVVDQFEEVFTLCRDEAERSTFLANLLYAATVPDGPTGVLVALRADFYHRCAAYPELAQQLAAQQYLVSPMTHDGLRQAVEEPARRVGLSFEPGLVATILEDVADRPGALPLLEHALFEVWQRRTGATLTLAAYRESGGVEGALAKRAEAVFDELAPDEQDAVRRLFLRLTQPGEGTEDTRRRARLSELDTGTGAGETAHVLSRLTDARLVTTSREEAAGGELIEVTHEALIRGWPRLRGWIDEDRAGLRVHRRLTDAAGEWERLDRDPSTLLRGQRLAEALAWREAHSPSLSKLELDFLDASRAAEQDALERARRRARRLRVLVAVLAVLLAAALGAGWWALRQTDAANSSRDEAMSQAQLASARALAAGSVVRRSPIEAFLGSLESYRLVLDAPAPQRFEPRNSLVTVLEQNDRLLGVVERDSSDAAFSPDGTLVAIAGDGGTVQLWDARRRAPVGEPLDAGRPDWVDAVAFSPNGRLLAAAGGDGTVRLWDVGRRDLAGKPLPGNGEPVLALAFSPDGQTLASGGSDRMIRLWDVARRVPAGPPLRGHTGEVRSVAFGPGGRTLASSGEDGTVRLWDVEAQASLGGPLGRDSSGSVDQVTFGPGGLLASAGYDGVQLWDVDRRVPLGGPLTDGGGWFGTVAFDRDGTVVAAAGEDGIIRLWDVESRMLGTRLEGHSNSVWTIAYSRDGRRLVSTGADGTVRLWNMEPAPLAVPLNGHTDEVWSLAVGPGQRLASAGADGTVRLWDTRRVRPLGPPLIGHDGGVRSVAFARDGAIVASAGIDGTVRLWDVTRRTELGSPLEGHTGEVSSVAFSPDGTLLASAGADDTVRLWDVARSAPAGAPLEAQSDGVWVVAFSPDGRTLATGGTDGTVRFWDVRRRTPIGKPLEGHEETVRSIAFSPDGTRLASTGEDGTVRLWDVARRAALGKPLVGHTGWALGVAFSPDGGTLASAGADGTVWLWDVRQRVPLGRKLYGHGDSWIESVAFDDRGRLISAGDDAVVLLWDPVLTSADIAGWQRRLCAVVGRNLTRAEWHELLPEEPYRKSCPELG